MQQEQIILALNILWDIIRNWWWVCLPFILYPRAEFFWLYGRGEAWSAAQKSVLLEIRMPQEVLKPIRAMEQVFSSIWGNILDPADRWEKWVEGKSLLSLQIEMISLDGDPHLFIRVHESRRGAVETSIYSQYPEAEITVAQDYTKNVPQDVPNKDWDIWGTDYKLAKDSVYPIKTYSKFFEEQSEAKEEKRIDPMATLLEGLSSFGPGEQLWIQLSAKAILNSKKPEEGQDFFKKGREVADKLSKRPEKSKPGSILHEAAKELVTGKPPGADEVKVVELFPAEMRLTPGEKDIVIGVEEKISKRMFECYLRFIYLAKKDAYVGGAKAIPFGHFQQFATENLNSLLPLGDTLTKVKKHLFFLPANLVRLRRVFVKKRRLFVHYIRRQPPFFPKPGGMFLLNSEEMATLFHFPGKTVAPAPAVSRVESKKGQAPPGLPMEE